MKQLNVFFICSLVLLFQACLPNNLSYTDAQQRNSRKLETDAQRQDAEFLVDAQNYNLFFTTASAKAAEQAYARIVSDFAKQAQDDHRRIADDLKKLAKEEKMALPAEMSDRHQELINELNRADQNSFDRAYLNSTEALYERAIRLYEDAALRANDSNIRAYAASKLDVLRSHERKADELENQLL